MLVASLALAAKTSPYAHLLKEWSAQPANTACEELVLVLKDFHSDMSAHLADLYPMVQSCTAKGFPDVQEFWKAARSLAYESIKTALAVSDDPESTPLVFDPADPSRDGNYGISTCCARGFTWMVELLLTDDRVDAADSNCLIEASMAGHDEIVKLLLDIPEVDPSASSNMALKNAAARGHWRVVELLCKSPKLKVQPVKNIAFMAAVVNGHVKAAQALIDNGTVEDLTCLKGLLNETIWNGHEDMIVFLLNHPAFKDKTPLFPAFGSACFYGKPVILEAFLDGFDIDPTLDFYVTDASHHASCIKVLLQDPRVDYRSFVTLQSTGLSPQILDALAGGSQSEIFHLIKDLPPIETTIYFRRAKSLNCAASLFANYLDHHWDCPHDAGTALYHLWLDFKISWEDLAEIYQKLVVPAVQPDQDLTINYLDWIPVDLVLYIVRFYYTK